MYNDHPNDPKRVSVDKAVAMSFMLEKLGTIFLSIKAGYYVCIDVCLCIVWHSNLPNWTVNKWLFSKFDMFFASFILFASFQNWMQFAILIKGDLNDVRLQNRYAEKIIYGLNPIEIKVLIREPIFITMTELGSKIKRLKVL